MLMLNFNFQVLIQTKVPFRRGLTLKTHYLPITKPLLMNEAQETPQVKLHNLFALIILTIALCS